MFQFQSPIFYYSIEYRKYFIRKKEKEKILKDKIKEDNNNDDIYLTVKTLLNMSDYSLYNYLITQKGSRDVQTILKKIKENKVEILI